MLFKKTDKIEAYIDANRARSVISRKSTSRYCLSLCVDNLVTWRSKKQNVVAKSSAEAEYRAMSLETSEEISLNKVLFDLCQDSVLPMKLYCDNKAAISIANNLAHMIEQNMWKLTNTL
ncbi:putative mitochondrial protein [Cucumis melo var. makuwa]|uniref:Mitochondrial protein n=1 Tax=Cucumis melo var. makuwa TaxID=1194695 RepID=A0A5A7U2F5_CUCMM|nr:putative mitochondrial protein [Cucumis melo var. makuwa]TYK28233.1 putative mitochondrial protein [Cucumis melo var. makuwa]